MPQTNKIFISYRRDDSEGSAGRLYDSLSRRLGKDRIFKDVDSIRLADDFSEVIKKTISECKIVLVVIGRHFVNENNRVRLLSEGDYLRQEIAMALQLGKKVIPILVDRASMPAKDELPEIIQALVERNGDQLNHDKWDGHVEALSKKLEDILYNTEYDSDTVMEPVKIIQISTNIRRFGRIFGLLCIIFPYLFIIASLLSAKPIQSTIGNYYDILPSLYITIMSSIALLLLLTWDNDGKDNIIYTLSGLLPFGQIFFHGFPIVELTLFALFWVIQAFVLIFFFTKRRYFHTLTWQESRRIQVYRVCGVIILVCMVLMISVNMLFDPIAVEQNRIIFWFESIAYSAIGVAWLTKSEMIFSNTVTKMKGSFNQVTT